ncbi:MAG: hypothetical protein QHD01_14295 [Bradyrhizobium sp.]|uniref:hypothetical protein n=1 Tax=Bradyrhizobium sp. TaxID=376 RepID=UPI0029A8B9CD|nr:hypothetical protein [Bradyrhizobium sp.]MDX3967758.1 hypothetical protein [Bradyrhizobium sp.]
MKIARERSAGSAMDEKSARAFSVVDAGAESAACDRDQVIAASEAMIARLATREAN